MAEELRMTFFGHLEELRRRVGYSLAAFLVVFFLVYTMSIREGELWGMRVYYIYPDFYDNIPAQLFEVLRSDLLPPDIVLLNIQGIDALLVDVKLAMFLSVVIAMPFFVWQAARFLVPALYPREKSFIAKLVLPATALFITGALFSYFLFTPFALAFFFSFGDQLGVGVPDPYNQTAPPLPTIAVGSFLSWVTIMVLAFGLIFELPVFMTGMTYLGLVGARAWYNGWRYALIAFLIVGGIITPDASGLTQLLVAIPMFGLYMGGVGIAFLIERRSERPSG